MFVVISLRKSEWFGIYELNSTDRTKVLLVAKPRKLYCLPRDVRFTHCHHNQGGKIDPPHWDTHEGISSFNPSMFIYFYYAPSTSINYSFVADLHQNINIFVRGVFFKSEPRDRIRDRVTLFSDSPFDLRPSFKSSSWMIPSERRQRATNLLASNWTAEIPPTTSPISQFRSIVWGPAWWIFWRLLRMVLLQHGEKLSRNMWEFWLGGQWANLSMWEPNHELFACLLPWGIGEVLSMGSPVRVMKVSTQNFKSSSTKVPHHRWMTLWLLNISYDSVCCLRKANKRGVFCVEV